MIERNMNALASQTVLSLQAARAIGDSLGMVHGSAARLEAAYTAAYGTVGAQGAVGSVGAVNAARAAWAGQRSAKRAQEDAARTFCRRSINLLKNTFGNTWTPAWNAVGFQAGSLRLPKDVLPVLTEMRNYLATSPEAENGPQGITRIAAEALLTDLTAARHGFASAKASIKEALMRRNQDLATLRKRMIALYSELTILLPRDDQRWYQFGFRRPVDGRVPGPVEGLTLSAGAPGEIIVRWNPSARATKYRVRMVARQSGVVEPEAELKQVQFAPVRECTLRGLAPGWEVTVYVTAYNAAAETVPAQVTGRVV